MAATPSENVSPWRSIFEDVRRSVGTRRDDNGMLGSINWLRKQMEVRGANPNVVRNIIYRDKGKLSDKRVLFEILDSLWRESGHPPLKVPELEVMLSPGSSAENEVLQLLGREKRRAFRAFVSGVRGGEHPKLLVTGRPGSGKTLLTDYIQQALELAPEAHNRLVRLEFSSADLAAALSRLAAALGVSDELLESRLVKIGGSGAYAVQADAQADVARLVLDAARHAADELVLLLHVSQSLAGQDSLGMAPLRLNTPEVPRVSASEWLWLTLFEPLARMPRVSILVSMTEVPARAMQRLGAFEGPVKLSPPTTSEARRFVKARLPHLPPGQQDDIVQRAGRSFEELRTLTLLAEIREPAASERPPSVAAAAEGGAGGASEAPIRQLSRLVAGSGDNRLRDFLAALAVLSIPEFPAFDLHTLNALRGVDETPSSLEMAFLDSVPGRDHAHRAFSRKLTRSLRAQLLAADPERYRRLQRDAARLHRDAAVQAPKGEAASRYLHHLFEARHWPELIAWLERHPIQQSLVRRIWQAAEAELPPGAAFERVAQQVAAHYVKLGSYEHRDAEAAFEVLAASGDPEVRAWTTLKRAEGAVLKGRFEQAEALLADWPPVEDPLLCAEEALVRASVARWRSELDAAARIVAEEARPWLARVVRDDAAAELARAKAEVWAGLIAKDGGDLERALHHLRAVAPADDLIDARLAFQIGDVELKLGRFDAALRNLDRAVQLSHRSEALVQEQTRYLARRGTLYRKRGDLAAAAADFRAARAILDAAAATDPLEHAFWRAKIDDEAALEELARGRFENATFALRANIDCFRRYAEHHGVDASYRLLRSTLRLAIAYGCRGLQHPYRTPFLRAPVAGPDLDHARALLDEVVAALERHPDRQHQALARDALQAASLFAPAGAERGQAAERSAAGLARRALALARFPYQRAEDLAHLAWAELRGGELAAAAERATEGLALLREAEANDAGLRAWLRALPLLALVPRGAADEAAGGLSALLRDPALAPFHKVVLRAYGEALEHAPGSGWFAHPELRELLQLPDGFPDTRLVRLPDALVSRWQDLREAVPS